MEKIVAQREFNFGDIDYYGDKKLYPVHVTIELSECGGDATFHIINGQRKYTGEVTPKYLEFSATGNIGDIFGGQCLEEIAKFIKAPLFWRIYGLWKNYHLNGMHAGTPEQECAIKEWKTKNKYDYFAACEYLKSIGLYEIPFYGKTVGKVWSGEPYRYGEGWVIDELPKEVIREIFDICGVKDVRRYKYLCS